MKNGKDKQKTKKSVIEDSDEKPTPTKPKHDINMKQETLKKSCYSEKVKISNSFKEIKETKTIQKYN